ncbi:MAG TPA: glycosyltransferase [Paludibaculum sp.]|jgi:GT2 family glycosyltransferase
MADERDARLAEALQELKEARSENRALRIELSNLDERLAALERSVVFRGLRAVGLQGQLIQRKAGQALLKSGLHPLYAKLMGGRAERAYDEWLGRHRAADPLRGVATEGALLSIVLPTRAPKLEWLRAALNSVASQTYRSWQLCVCVDGEIGPEADEFLLSRAAEDPRVVVVRLSGAGISAALNRALAEAQGEFVAFLDHDDVLEPTALAHVSQRLSGGGLDIVYSDEGYIDEQGAPLQPSFKPGWSPELLLSCMYMGHLLVSRRSSAVAAGGFRMEMDGAQDYDLVLRMVEQGARAGHIPRVLYHWRRHGGSTASSQAAKPYAQEAGRRALEDAVRRRGWAAAVTLGERPNSYRVVTEKLADELISIVIPTKNATLLARCLESQGTGAERIIVRHLGNAAEDSRIAAVAAAHQARVVDYAGTFNFSKMCNEGARAATGAVLVFLNDDVEPVSKDWLARLCGTLGREGVGIVGARLLYPQGSIQHVGLVLGMSDGVGHLGRYLLASSNWPWIDFTRDVSAATGACLAIRRVLFTELGGFDEAFPLNYNDVDLCLRARAAGHRVVLENDAVLIHREAMTRQGGTSAEERLLFQQRWCEVLAAGDKYFTPHLRLDAEDLSLRQ